MKTIGSLNTRRGRQMIEWIAMNDQSGAHDDVETISGYVTVVMLSHIYGVPTRNIADNIKQIRDSENL